MKKLLATSHRRGRQGRLPLVAVLIGAAVVATAATGSATLAASVRPTAAAGATQQAAACTASAKAANQVALRAFKRTAARRRAAYFRAHPRVRAREAYLKREHARLHRLQAAAACDVRVTPAAAQVIASIPINAGQNLVRMVAANGSLWVNRAFPGSVTQIDPASATVTASVPAGSGAEELGGDIAYGFGSIWEVDHDSNTVTRIDPTTHRVLATIPTGGTAPWGLAITSQAVWVANHNEPPVPNGANVVEIDPTTNRVVDTVPGIGGAQGGPAWITSVAGSVWAVNPITAQIARIDTTTDKITTTINSPGACACAHFTTDGTTVWFTAPSAQPAQSELRRIDTTTNTITTAVTGAELDHYGLAGALPVTFAAGALWLTGPCGNAGCLLRIDPATNNVTGDWTFPGSPDAGDFFELAYTDGAIWIAEHNALLKLNVSQ